jgi:two-component system, sensor histidine kinase ChiS
MITREEIEFTTSKAMHPGDLTESGYCVLLAEDDRALRRYLEVVLQRAGYRVVSAADGLEAMKILLNTSVDAIITDAIMPNLSGYELCRFVRSSQHLSHLPLMLLSALDPKNAASEAESVDAFLAKPVSSEELVECLNRLVSARR